MDLNQQLEISVLFEDISPMGNKKVAVLIGRFNPPTRGHYKVINEVKKFIRSKPTLDLEVTPVVIVIGGSKSDSDKKRNPLSVEDRVTFMASSGNADGVIFLTAKNAFEAFALVRKQNFEPIAIAAGSDRIDDYIRILDKHFLDDNGKPIKHYAISLQRDEEAVDTNKEEKKTAMDRALADFKTGKEIDDDFISGSLARRAVEIGDEEAFANIVGLESKPSLAKIMFNKLKAILVD